MLQVNFGVLTLLESIAIPNGKDKGTRSKSNNLYETSEVVSVPGDPVQVDIHKLLPDYVVSTSEVFDSVFLIVYEFLWVEELAVGSCSLHR